MERDLFADLRAELWRRLDEYRGKPFTLDLLRDTLAQSGRPLDWRAALVFGEMLSTHGEFSLAPHVVEFAAAYAALRERKQLFDPFVRVPSLLAAAAEESGADRAVGYVGSQSVEAIAREICNSRVEWHLGDLLRTEDAPTDDFDLIVSAPPLGMRMSGIKGDATYQLLVESAKHLAAEGEMLFLLGEGFNFARDATAARSALSAAGINVEAVVSVADATRETATPLQWVVFGRGDASEDLFVARLTAQMDVQQVARTAVDRAQGSTIELGLRVRRVEYASWEQFAARDELERLFSKTPYPRQRLGDLATDIARVELVAGEEFAAAPNALYLTEVRANPVLAPSSDGAKRRAFVEVTLDPERAHAEFLAAWFESPAGRLSRGSVMSGATIPRLTAAAATAMPVVLPPLELQLDVLRVEARLRSLALEAAEMRSRLWLYPGSAREIEAGLRPEDPQLSFDRWMESLPFPLASIAYRYVAVDSVEDKVATLLHFYEAAAEFAATLLLSAVRSDAALYEEEREKIARPDPTDQPSLEQGTFGTWIYVGRTLAKSVRRLLSDAESDDVALRLFGVRGSRLATGLASKALWQVLDDARVIRNARAHGGIEAGAARRRRLERLETLLLDLRAAIGPAFDLVDLVQPIGMTYRQGVFHHRARRLMGPNSIFRVRDVDAVFALDSDYLYLVEPEGLVTTALAVLPFFRVMQQPETEQNAIYFYSSRQRDGALRYISYHFEGQPEAPVVDPVLSSLLDDLTPRSEA